MFEVDYEIMEADIRFLKNSGLKISETDLERIIDVFEKISVTDHDQSKSNLTRRMAELF